MGSNEFQHFDYGESENMEVYGTKKAPAYDLGKVTAPIAMYFGDNGKTLFTCIFLIIA